MKLACALAVLGYLRKERVESESSYLFVINYKLRGQVRNFDKHDWGVFLIVFWKIFYRFEVWRWTEICVDIVERWQIGVCLRKMGCQYIYHSICEIKWRYETDVMSVRLVVVGGHGKSIVVDVWMMLEDMMVWSRSWDSDRVLRSRSLTCDVSMKKGIQKWNIF